MSSCSNGSPNLSSPGDELRAIGGCGIAVCVGVGIGVSVTFGVLVGRAGEGVGVSLGLDGTETTVLMMVT